MNKQPSLIEASRPDGRVVDETGDLDEYGDHGAVYVDGEYDLEETVDLLSERFDDVRDDLPDQVGEWSRDGFRYHRRVSAAWSRVTEDGDEEIVSLFPRGPWLHEWSLNIERHRSDSEVSGASMSGFIGSGYDTPAAALRELVSHMEGSQ